MGRNSPSRQRHRNKFKLQWAPVLRAVRAFATAAQNEPEGTMGKKLKKPAVTKAAKDLMGAAQAWHQQWEHHRIKTGMGFMEASGSLPAPRDHFHRLQRACKSYGYSLRKGADMCERTAALSELLECAATAPLEEKPFQEAYSSEESCLKATNESGKEGHTPR